MTTVIWNFILLSAAIFVVAQLLPTIRIKNYVTALWVALVYSLINLAVGWLLVFLAFPLIIVTFGLFKFVINAFLLWMTDQVTEDFEIEGFTSTLLAAFLIAVLDSFLRWIL